MDMKDFEKVNEEIINLEKTQIEDLNEQITLLKLQDQYEQAWMGQICDTKDASGKVLFSNDASRKAELAKKLTKDLDYQKALVDSKNITNVIKVRSIDIDGRKRIFNAMLALCKGDKL